MSLNSSSLLVWEKSEDSLMMSWLIFSTMYDYLPESKAMIAWVNNRCLNRNFFRSSSLLSMEFTFYVKLSCCVTLFFPFLEQHERTVCKTYLKTFIFLILFSLSKLNFMCSTTYLLVIGFPSSRFASSLKSDSYIDGLLYLFISCPTPVGFATGSSFCFPYISSFA